MSVASLREDSSMESMLIEDQPNHAHIHISHANINIRVMRTSEVIVSNIYTHMFVSILISCVFYCNLCVSSSTTSHWFILIWVQSGMPKCISPKIHQMDVGPLKEDSSMKAQLRIGKYENNGIVVLFVRQFTSQKGT